MSIQPIIFLFSILGAILFLVHYSKVKVYLSRYSEIFGIVAIIYFLNIIVGHYYFDIELDINVISIVIIGFLRNLLVASVATYYFYDELKINVAPFFIKEERDKSTIIQILKFTFLTLLVLVIMAIFFITLSGNEIINIRSISFDVGIYTILNSFFISFSEEVFVRLYLFGLISYWFRRIKGNFVIAAILSSLLWSLDHFLVEVMIMKFFFLFFMGILLSILTLKKGIESSIIVHGIFNTLAFLALGYMK